MEGHTDAKPYDGTASYSNWELSADRANSARRLMQAKGLREERIAQVRGFAAQRLLKPEDPLDPSNRWVSVIVQYLNKPESTAEPGSAASVAKASAPAKASH